MSALSRIKKAGFKVFLDGDNLGITPANNLTLSQREFLKSHKAEIITELKAEVIPEAATPDNNSFVSCGKCLHFKCNNQHGRGAGYCIAGGDYGAWSESPHQCTQFDEAVEWLELSEPKPNALMVTCFTPNGKPIQVEARDEIHAEFLRRWNPKHQPS